MIKGMQSHSFLHSLRHEALRFVDDHAVLLCDEEPGRPVLPERPIDFNSDASRRNRPLDGRQQRQLIGGSVLYEGRSEGFLGQVDQAVVVGRQLRGLRVWDRAVEHVGDGLALIGSERETSAFTFWSRVDAMTAPA